MRKILVRYGRSAQITGVGREDQMPKRKSNSRPIALDVIGQKLIQIKDHNMNEHNAHLYLLSP